MTVQDAYNGKLCKNDQINRRLSIDSICLVADWMQSNGFGQWTSASREKFFVYWQPIQTVADAIHKWAYENARIGSVEIVMDLVDDNSTKNEIFHKMPVEIVIHACRALAEVNKAQLIMAESVDDVGVKFFDM